MTQSDDPLEKVVWNSLSSRHSRFALGTDKAKRFNPDISPFAATGDNTRESLQDLASLLSGSQDEVYFIQVQPVCLPDEMELRMKADGLLLVRERDAPDLACGHVIQDLGPADAEEMLDLALLTKPGPFKLRTRELGRFIGVRIDGRLAAMAGERMSLEGYTEVSGVCTHPDFRSKGLAAALSDEVSRRIAARGDTPFLHSYASNEGALKLYRKLGFAVRHRVNVAIAGLRG
ncbi:GNAT family N-acetyltransferase [Roseibium litorale]|uniref:GNAT family N-acetyltransferase n=1 Tax=Roseibium litorale TaxID=2803841 RepID=A0ABR9CJ20_9HYPH|nr:GNAT family N-acetyltransferase [Roseibium litorale]MBD8890634.1 GNAT family N-acetyltransferase [Roseibium litorale]